MLRVHQHRSGPVHASQLGEVVSLRLSAAGDVREASSDIDRRQRVAKTLSWLDWIQEPSHTFESLLIHARNMDHCDNNADNSCWITSPAVAELQQRIVHDLAVVETAATDAATTGAQRLFHWLLNSQPTQLTTSMLSQCVTHLSKHMDQWRFSELRTLYVSPSCFQPVIVLPAAITTLSGSNTIPTESLRLHIHATNYHMTVPRSLSNIALLTQARLARIANLHLPSVTLPPSIPSTDSQLSAAFDACNVTSTSTSATDHTSKQQSCLSHVSKPQQIKWCQQLCDSVPVPSVIDNLQWVAPDENRVQGHQSELTGLHLLTGQHIIALMREFYESNRLNLRTLQSSVSSDTTVDMCTEQTLDINDSSSSSVHPILHALCLLEHRKRVYVLALEGITWYVFTAHGDQCPAFSQIQSSTSPHSSNRPTDAAASSHQSNVPWIPLLYATNQDAAMQAWLTQMLDKPSIPDAIPTLTILVPHNVTMRH